MTIRIIPFAVILLGLSATGLAAQDLSRAVDADLAIYGAATTITVNPGTAIGALTILNRMPGANYDLSVVRRAIEVEVLDIQGFFREAQGDTDAGIESADPCAALDGADSEAVIARILATIPQGCPGTTSIHAIGLELGRNEELVITISRSLPSAKTWVITLTTGRDGKWYTTYGFTFLPNRDKRYFSRPETEGFSIAEQNDREDFDFRPSILFHYQLPRTHNHSLVAGLGYDLESIAVFGGYGYTFNSNVTITAGVAIHEQEDLVGRYEVGDKLQDAIDSAQLVEKTFAPNVYVGISFRFGSNVFGGGE